jgi:FkbM family methyltransferase
MLFRTDFSYSAAGEDRLVLHWLVNGYGLAESEIRYCDIGANHPRKLSNTFALYQRGARGVLVEPDPTQATLLRKVRPRDTVLNVGAAFDGKKTAKLKRFTSSVFNTFSEERVDVIVEASKGWRPNQAQALCDEIEVDLVPVNDILAANFRDDLHFLSIDAEGVDLQIMKSIDFDRFRPKIICVEADGDFDAILKPIGYEFTAQTPDNLIYRAPR